MWPFVGLSLLYAALKLCLVLIANRSLSGGEAGDGYAERAAGHVVQTDLVAELDGGRIAAVLAADAEVQVGAGLAAESGGHLDELADADLVEAGERIVLVDLQP